MGLGTEKFSNEDGHISGFDSVYFPIYMPRDKKKSSKTKDDKDTEAAGTDNDSESFMNNNMADFVKMKVRAAYKGNKSK